MYNVLLFNYTRGTLQEATTGLEKRMTNISTILQEKKLLAQKDAELSEREYTISTVGQYCSNIVKL